MKRYLVQLPQDSADLELVRTYCDQHNIQYRQEVWHMDSKEYLFTVIYTVHTKYVAWLELQYPNSFTAF